jgi:hypothetical protein
MSGNRTLADYRPLFQELFGIGTEGHRRNPANRGELRDVCLKMRPWVTHRHEELLSKTRLGRWVLADGLDHRAEIDFLRELQARVAEAEAVDRVAAWCGGVLSATGEATVADGLETDTHRAVEIQSAETTGATAAETPAHTEPPDGAVHIAQGGALVSSTAIVLVTPQGRQLVFEPGAFTYRGHRKELSGKPLAVLRALSEATGQVLTLADLQDKVWPGCGTGEEAIRSAVSAARKALREAMRAVNVDGPPNPLPAVDRGTGRTAWRLALP